MKKKLFLALLAIIMIELPALTEGIGAMGIPSNFTHSGMFSIEETKPYSNLERTNSTNRAIMSIESRYNSASLTKNSNNEQGLKEDKPRKKGFFEGFVIDW